jgi:hypothetical protein
MTVGCIRVAVVALPFLGSCLHWVEVASSTVFQAVGTSLVAHSSTRWDVPAENTRLPLVCPSAE